MDFKLRPSSSSESFKDKLSRSSVFTATIEQAQISISKSRINREVLNINREKTGLRSSSTFESSLFKESLTARPRENAYKPKDSISLNHIGGDFDTFYRKSIVSDFQPNFQPKYKYESTWRIDSSTFKRPEQQVTIEQPWFKPVVRKNSQTRRSPTPRLEKNETRSVSPQVFTEFSQKSDFHKNRVKSTKASSKFSSRAVTPQPRCVGKKQVCTEPNRISTEESLQSYQFARIDTEPDKSGRSVLSDSNTLFGRKTETKGNEGSFLECKPWDYSKEMRSSRENERGNRDEYEKVVKAWKSSRILAVFSSGTGVPSYMRKTISSICKSRK